MKLTLKKSGAKVIGAGGMFKAMVLMCGVWIVKGQPQQQCFTHMFEWEFKTSQQCELRLAQYRIYELPKNQKIILDDCIRVKKS